MSSKKPPLKSQCIDTFQNWHFRDITVEDTLSYCNMAISFPISNISRIFTNKSALRHVRATSLGLYRSSHDHEVDFLSVITR